MMRSVRKVVLGLLSAGLVLNASAFTLLGPWPAWQVFRIGYQVGGDIGGPMNLTEEYRWNIKTITYGFDRTFLDYFGEKGVQEVEKAIAILNGIPPVSKMRADLSEFPLDTRRYNARAAALQLFDLKSTALAIMVEEMGLGSPDRYVWCLRSRVTFPGDIKQYSVIMRNFDPVTWYPSKYVNGTLYTYDVIDAYWAPDDGSDAVESAVDPLAPTYTAVASYGETMGSSTFGQFFTGLTRDDAGGLRYMLRPGNANFERLVWDMLPDSGGVWSPVGNTTNLINTNALVNIAQRPGVDKIVFKRVKNAPRGGYLKPTVVHYKDTYYDGNGKKRTQRGQRVLGSFTNDVVIITNSVVADIVFSAGDLGISAGGYLPVLARSAGWVDNSDINTQANLGLNAGPGIIEAPIFITFNNVGPFNFHQSPDFIDEANQIAPGWQWGSFDGTTNIVVYPDQNSVEALENEVLREGN
jgi:hypothetical protein